MESKLNQSREIESGSIGSGKPYGEVFDRSVALENVGGNAKQLRELAILFLEEFPKLLSGIRESLAHHDSEALQLHAHTLKGDANLLGAMETSQVALRLELMGRAADTTDADAAFAELEEKTRRLEQALKEFVAE